MVQKRADGERIRGGRVERPLEHRLFSCENSIWVPFDLGSRA